MAGIINVLSQEVEQWVQDNTDISPDSKIKNWGFVELAVRTSKGKKSQSDQPIPMTINGTGDRQQVSLDDRYDFIFWVRWIGQLQSILSEEDSWGLREGKRFTFPLRLVVAHKVELGENLILDLVNGLPESLTVAGFDFVYLTSSISVDPNHEEIYRIELGDTVYEQHRFDWNIYVININVEYVQCPPGVAVEEGRIFDYTFALEFE